MNSPIFRDQTFDTFDEFLQVFNEYSKQTFTLWTKTDSAKRGQDDDNFKYVHLKCIHYRTQEEISSKSTGKRPKQSYVAPFGCLAEIRVNYVVNGPLKNKYQVTKCNLEHDRLNLQTKSKEVAHQISKEDFIKHPSNRRLKSILCLTLVVMQKK